MAVELFHSCTLAAECWVLGLLMGPSRPLFHSSPYREQHQDLTGFSYLQLQPPAGPVKDAPISGSLLLFGAVETLTNANDLGDWWDWKNQQGGGGTSHLWLRPAPAASSTEEMAERRCRVLIHICECEPNKHSFGALGGATLLFSAPGN